jgi:hypothetical protein
LREEAEKAHQGCKNAWNFLSRKDSLRRLISFRVVLEPFRKLKSSHLTRNGADWEVTQQANSINGQRQVFHVAVAASNEELHSALSFSTLLKNMDSAAWCSAQMGTLDSSEFSKRFRMVARAGGVLSRMCEMN